MEKLCIVNRKRNTLHDLENEGIYSLMDNIGVNREDGYPYEELGEDENRVLLFNLTPEQSDLVRTDRRLNSLLNGTANSPFLDVQRHENSPIVFKFHFEETDTVKLLKSKEVCHMLRISPGFLMKLVKKKKFKSYKLGRTRRFSLESVLSYLTESDEI
jgi:excisionase family DNA binding protein